MKVKVRVQIGQSLPENDKATFTFEAALPLLDLAAGPHRWNLGATAEVIGKQNITQFEIFVPGFYCMGRRRLKIMIPVASLERLRSQKRHRRQTAQGLATNMIVSGTVSGK